YALHININLPSFFFFNAPAPTEIYTLSLHDALPISGRVTHRQGRRPDLHAERRAVRRRKIWYGCRPRGGSPGNSCFRERIQSGPDRKSTRLNSSHLGISYAVFCLKKKK